VADVIGRAIIEVAPDVTRFGRQLTRDLRQVTRGFKKISVGVSVGSIRKAFVEVSKLNLALRAATIGFVSLGAQSIAAGLLSTAAAATQLAGAAAVLPALGAAAGAGFLALKVGLFGVDDVMKAFLKGDMDKFNEKLKELSPNAQKALGVLKEFAPQLKAFKNAVQDALFKDLQTTFRDLGTKLLPTVKNSLTAIAGQFNVAARALGKFATSAETIANLDDTLDNVKRSFHTLVPATTSFAQILRDVTVVGSNFLPGIAAQITVATEGFAAFIAKAKETGALDRFIGRGLAALEQLVGAVANLVSGFAGVLRAAHDAGFGIIDIISRIAAKFSEFANSLEGQGALRRFFANAKAGVDALLPVLGALFTFFNNQFFPIVTRIATILGPSLVVFINAIGDAFEAARPGIEAFATGVGKFLEGIAPALPSIGRLAGAIGATLGKVLERIAPVLERVIILISDTLTKILSDPAIVDGIVSLANAFGEVLVAIIPLLPPLIKLVIAILPFLISLVRAVIPVFESLEPILKVLAPLIGAMALSLMVLTRGLSQSIEPMGAFSVRTEAAADKSTIFSNALMAAANPLGFFRATVEEATSKSAAAVTSFVESAQGSLVDRLPGSVLRPAGDAVTGFWGEFEAQFAQGNVTAEVHLAELKRIMTGQIEPLSSIGSALGVSFTGGFGRSVVTAKDAAFGTMSGIRSTLDNRSGIFAAGASLGDDFAAGIIGKIAKVRQAAQELMRAAAAPMPRSPAEIGPFSGKGWSPFRGKALAEGFAQGITTGTSDIRTAVGRMIDTTSLGFDSAVRLPSTAGGARPPLPSFAPQVSATTGPINVQVLLDGRELRTIAVEVVDERDRDLLRGLRAGVGGTL